MDAVIEGFSAAVLAAAHEGRVLRPRGGGSKDFYGNALAGDVLDVSAYQGIVDYDPAELFITARCGTRLVEVEAALAQQGQMLACDPPQFSVQATLGGAVAAGLSGPRRVSVGALRDQVLGVRLLDGAGQVLNFGGQVMKNVAGFDVARVLTGSLGTLGVLLEISLKVLPLPKADLTLRFELDDAAAIQRMNQLAGQAWPLVASAWSEGVLSLRLAGAEAAVAAARTSLGGEALSALAAAQFWSDVRDQRLPWFPVDAPLWRLALPATTPPLGPQFGSPLIEWHGAQRWLRGGGHDMQTAAQATASQLGGHATLFRGGDKAAAAGVFQPMPATLRDLNQRLRAAFDPQGVFDNGRL